jgi:glyoxylase-like metal-dependent hydrolase (beta-lactamase superfamily II)
MTIHILNCGTLHPYLPRIHGGVTCLLVETNLGPALVDTGFGTGDYQNPDRAMRLFTAMLGCPRELDETAYHQVQRLGYRPEEVKHIIMTHLHLDHAGGLPDFPHAEIHLWEAEHAHITGKRTGWTFNSRHFAHSPHWVPHPLSNETWFGFDAIRLPDFEPETWLVPLPGHTPGHAGVAVRRGDGWLFHAGDAVPFNAALEEIPNWISKPLLGPHGPRILALIKTYPEIQVVGAHMTLEFYQQAEE